MEVNIRCYRSGGIGRGVVERTLALCSKLEKLGFATNQSMHSQIKKSLVSSIIMPACLGFTRDTQPLLVVGSCGCLLLAQSSNYGKCVHDELENRR